MTARLSLLLTLLALLFALLLATTQLFAAPTLSSLTLTEVADIDDIPTEVTHAGDDRLFIVEKSGYVHIVDGSGNQLATPFLDIDSLVNSGGERGLLGLAFAPDYATSGDFYVSYSDNGGDTVIARYGVSAGDVNVADSAETIILQVDQPAFNHNGGAIRFGPDGYLYIALGDGGGQGDPSDLAQDGSSLLGKVLRIDVTGQATYTIPASNPYTQTAGTQDEIWAMGIRNPWRFDFDSQTGDLWLADVGQNRFEEVSMIPAGTPGGVNLGWDCYEGEYEYDSLGDTDSPSAACNSSTDYLFPVHAYAHNSSLGRRSITGGTVYRGSENPAIAGLYFFGDYRSDEVWALMHSPSATTVMTLTVTGTSSGGLTTWGTDNDGELYMGFGNGKVFAVSTPDTAPTSVGLAGAPVASQFGPHSLLFAFVIMLTTSAIYHKKRSHQ